MCHLSRSCLSDWKSEGVSVIGRLIDDGLTTKCDRSDSISGNRIGAHNPYSRRDYSAQSSVLEIRRDLVILRTP